MRRPIALLAALTALPAVSAAAIVADLLHAPFSTTAAGANAPYKIVNIPMFIDPASTTWMALSIGTQLRSDLPNLSGIPTIQSPQMNDMIRLTASLGGQSSAAILLDDNDAFNLRVGNQAIFYGFFSSVGSFNGFTTATYGGRSETGALTAFFDAQGAGTYNLKIELMNRFGPEAGNSNVYLLRDVVVPEPAAAAFAVALGVLRRRRR